MQDALYAELSTVRRVRIHGRVAETLERLHASELGRYAAELARHFAEAAIMNRSLAEKAVQYAELAAQEAKALAAWDDAARWYEQALTGLKDVGRTPIREGELLMELCRCLRAAGDRAVEGLRIFERAIAAYREHGDNRMLAAAVVRNLTGSVPSLPELAGLRGLLPGVLDGLGGEQSIDACFVLAFKPSTQRSSETCRALRWR